VHRVPVRGAIGHRLLAVRFAASRGDVSYVVWMGSRSAPGTSPENPMGAPFGAPIEIDPAAAYLASRTPPLVCRLFCEPGPGQFGIQTPVGQQEPTHTSPPAQSA
jgi:hypothetical protein